MKTMFATIFAGFVLFVAPAVAGSGSNGVVSQEKQQLLDLELARARMERGQSELTRLSDAMQRTKESGDEATLRSLNAQLDQLHMQLNAGNGDVTPAPRQLTQEELSPFIVRAGDWGNDVRIATGNLEASSERGIALGASTTGAIFAAANFIYRDTGSVIIIYKSLNGGSTWSVVNSFSYTTARIQSFDMNVTDSSNNKFIIGLTWVVRFPRTERGGSVIWGSVRDDGTGWRFATVRNATSAAYYKNVSLTSDGYLYSPASTWHYAAAERVLASTDKSEGISVFRSATFGMTWTVTDTASSGFEDTYPSIAVQALASSPDTLFVLYARRFTTTDRDIRVARNGIALSTTWSIKAITTSSDDEFNPSVCVSGFDKSGIVTYTRNFTNNGDLDVNYGYSTNGFNTFAISSVANSSSVDELFSAAHCVRDGSSDEWRVVYKSASTIQYKTTFSVASFGATSATLVSQHAPTTSLRPAIGAHYSGGWSGDVLYAGFGPTDLYFDASTLTSVSEAGVADGFALRDNYPNPFNPTTTIGFSIPADGNVQITIYNLLGQKVATLVDEYKSAGSYKATFDAAGLASGVYLYKMTAGNFSATKKFTLMK